MEGPLAVRLELLLAAVAGAAAAALGGWLVRARARRARARALDTRAAALQDAQSRLAEQWSGRETLLGRALEEIRRPLHLLSTSLELAQRRRREVPELVAAIADAHREATRIARMATRLAQLQSVARSVQRAPVDLAVLARAAVQQQVAAADKAGVALQLVAPQELPAAADGALVAQALDELLENALRASRFGGRVTLTLAREAALVRVEVRDEGQGLPADRRERAFEPFAVPGSAYGQPGLGLPLVREIARGHGGRAFLREGDGRGLVAVLELPAA